MRAVTLYEKLENDFIFPDMHDNFADYMTELHPFMTDNFKTRSMGLVFDFAENVSQVYTAVFPTEKVIDTILDEKTTDAMLFLHHPSIWSYRDNKLGFSQMDAQWLEKLAARSISIYSLHAPLDNYGPYSTSKTLAEAMGLEIIEPFAKYNGGQCGVIGRTNCTTVGQLQDVYSSAVGHETKLYQYGDEIIRDGLVSVVAGGGNDIECVQAAIDKGVNTHITGISVTNDKSADSHEFDKKNRVNILGGTHYSTEKFACQSMCVYFRKLGLPARFIKDVPTMEDL